MRRATDSDLSFAYDPQEGTGAIATVHGYAAVLSSDHIIENERQAASEGQSLGVIKVQRSLTWTEGSEMNHSQQGMMAVLNPFTALLVLLLLCHLCPLDYSAFNVMVSIARCI